MAWGIVFTAITLLGMLDNGHPRAAMEHPVKPAVPADRIPDPGMEFMRASSTEIKEVKKAA